MEKMILSAVEAADAMGIGKGKMLELLDAGEIPAYRDGKNWKVPARLLQEYIETKALEEAKKRRYMHREITMEEMQDAINRL